MRGTHAIGAAVLCAFALGATTAAAAPPQVHIAGNRFVDGAGKPLRLIGTTAGVGSATACVEPRYKDPPRVASHNVFYTPADDKQLALMRSWHMNTVRVTLNESCWNGVPLRYRDDRVEVVHGSKAAAVKRGNRTRYRRGLKGLVARAHAMGFITIVDLHLVAGGDALAWTQWPLPAQRRSLAFWRSVAKTFKSDRSMVFELYNEPYGKISWDCLQAGCAIPNACQGDECGKLPGCSVKLCPTQKHPQGKTLTAGMQALVDAVRGVGATQPLLTPGLNYSNDLSQWLEHMPTDPLKQLGATFHMYADHRYDNGCDDVACWEKDVARVAAVVPVSATEFGQFDCRHDVMDKFQLWADLRGVSYQAWGWYVADYPPCGNAPGDDHAPAMLADYDGATTDEGAGFKAHLQALHDAGELP